MVSLPRPPSAEPLVLSGFMATGKTTLGRAAAARAGVRFVDTDEELLAMARASEGRPFASVGEVLTALGEAPFRALEASVLRRATSTGEPCVIAVGGGALVAGDVRREVLSRCRVITLTASPATVLSRVRSAGAPLRPLLAMGDEELPARVDSLLAARSAAYAECHSRIATDDGRSIEEIADSILRAWQSRTLLMPLGDSSYPILFAGDRPAGAVVREVLADLRPSSHLHVTDETVRRLHGDSVLRECQSPAPTGALPIAGRPLPPVILPPGEREKHLGTLGRILESAVASGADRSSVLVAHGGGVVNDLTGFAAAVLLRGVRWVSVPTTLLSMADAAIGGKTGVDIGLAKNAAGAFHQPSAVVLDLRHVATETPRAFRSGLAEIVKAGAIADASLFAFLEERLTPAAADAESDLRALQTDLAFLEPAVAAAAAVKIRIVAEDPREAGVRALLNFGHTLGHALEAAGDFERWTHGEAVALGMIAAARAGVALGVTPPPVVPRLVAVLAACGLPTKLTGDDLRAALDHLGHDKKRSGAVIKAIFLTDIGRAVIHPLALSDLRRAFAEFGPGPSAG